MDEVAQSPEAPSGGRAAAGWELFAHDADVGVRGFGRSPAEALENVALALTAAVTDPADVRAETAVEIACEAPDLELLLNAWLNALVFEMATRRMLFARFEVRLHDAALTATAWGEPVSVARHQPAAEVKGATLTALRVAASDDGRWLAQCIVDV